MYISFRALWAPLSDLYHLVNTCAYEYIFFATNLPNVVLNVELHTLDSLSGW